MMRIRNYEEIWTGQTKQEKPHPSGWLTINKGQPLTTIARQDPGTLKVVRWSLGRFLKTLLRQEQESFKPIGKAPM